MIFPPQLTGYGLESLVGSIVGGLFRSHREHPVSDSVSEVWKLVWKHFRSTKKMLVAEELVFSLPSLLCLFLSLCGAL